MQRVTWTPKTNSQRGSLAQFGPEWQVSNTLFHERPSVIRGNRCWFIHPVGNPGEGRWVPADQVTLLTAKEQALEALLPALRAWVDLFDTNPATWPDDDRDLLTAAHVALNLPTA